MATKRKYRTDVAVDFFRSMLRRIGCETEVPIYNLYEYRVQATPEIRQESGHCVEDFQRFLRRHPEAFIVNCNDTVLLTRTESKPQPTHERAAMPGHRPGGQKKTPNSRDSMVEIEPVLTFTAEEVENYKAKALQSTRIIDNLEESRKVINEIFLGVRPGGYIAVSMGTEGVNLGPKGQVTLIQIGLMTGQVLIFDIQKCKELVFNGGLLKLMESQDVVKVIHACKTDRANLYHQFGIHLNNVFDTQTAYELMEKIKNGKRGHPPALNTVCGVYGAPQNPFKMKIKQMYQEKSEYWAERPLTDEMRVFAAADVIALVPHVYNSMIEALKQALLGESEILLNPQDLYLLRSVDLPRERKEQLKRLSDNAYQMKKQERKNRLNNVESSAPPPKKTKEEFFS